MGPDCSVQPRQLRDGRGRVIGMTGAKSGRAIPTRPGSATLLSGGGLAHEPHAQAWTMVIVESPCSGQLLAESNGCHEVLVDTVRRRTACQPRFLVRRIVRNLRIPTRFAPEMGKADAGIGNSSCAETGSLEAGSRPSRAMSTGRRWQVTSSCSLLAWKRATVLHCAPPVQTIPLAREEPEDVTLPIISFLLRRFVFKHPAKCLSALRNSEHGV